ncbi:hypothetical protein ZMO1_ZMOp36x050 (plasmid) [Zymomonas mobilis subsp. mobilis ZM4 = ATCC 31821]|uniref:hypothetical protein n=1 Tax=Zymomonas mobilis TaxID=542 RepID=UPI0007862935|nr:hypothetical protein [Zymomonas mobilis]QIZ64256.1 hypothetical protein ZMO1_ZMOp36x050 [Zymomonas mobilis subsp. mobilis ZM4 = ATCC 31821]UBQ08689.1 hypothetical protein LB319_09460 [Zymomonas mobilis]
MKIKYLFTAALALASTTAVAGLYKTCEIWAGKKNTCSMPYNGQTVILDRKIDPPSSRKHCCQ